jgi:hypothetical protein
LIENENGVCAGGDFRCDFVEMELHGLASVLQAGSTRDTASRLAQLFWRLGRVHGVVRHLRALRIVLRCVPSVTIERMVKCYTWQSFL